MNKNINKNTPRIILSFVLSLFLFSCSDDASKLGGKPGAAGPKGKRAAKAIPIEVAYPEIGLAASYYVTTATIEPSSDAKINSRTSGVVQQILHEEGDDVKSGDILLILDDDDQRLRLKQAEQKFESASREFKRLSKMKKAGVVSPTEWEIAENNFRTSETDKKLAELALSYTRVAAPFNGRVVWRDVDLGAHVGQGELLFRMMSISPLLVRVHIPANRLGGVAKGQSVELKVDSISTPLIANVELISPIVDPTTGTIKITLRIDQYPSSVRPGDFSEVHMVTDKHDNALLIPSVAIIEERGEHYVYLVEKNKAIRRAIKVGFTMTNTTEIVEGISQSDKVVIKGQRNLNDEVLVEILSEQKEKSDPSSTPSAAIKNKKERSNKNKRAQP